MKRLLINLAIAGTTIISGCGAPEPRRQTTETAPEEIKNISFTVIDSFAHDQNSYTEGLLFHAGQLFESTGYTENHKGTHSLFGVLDRQSGKIGVKARIDDRKYFGEGIVFLKGKVFQLTDTTQIGFVYDTARFHQLGSFTYAGEGWGLTTNSQSIIMSNGSSLLVWRDPETFDIIKTLSVTDNNGPVSNLNELELADSFIYANQWLTDYVLKIDSLDGKVVGRLDISALHQRALSAFSGSAEANGVAFDPSTNHFFITGKLWPKGYVLSLNP